jgi:hypothetical protein
MSGGRQEMGVDLVCQPLIGRRKPCFRRYGQHNDPAGMYRRRCVAGDGRAMNGELDFVS